MIHKGKLAMILTPFLVILFSFWVMFQFQEKLPREVINIEEATGCDSTTITRAMQYDSLLIEHRRVNANWEELKRRLARKEKYGEAPYRVIGTTKE